MPGIEVPRARLTPHVATRGCASRAATTLDVLLVRCPITWVPQYSVLCVESSAVKVTEKVQVLLGQRYELVVCHPSIPLPVVSLAPGKGQQRTSRYSEVVILT